MEIKILSEKLNPMLKRTEVSFEIEHGEKGSTPSRPEVKKMVAMAMKTDENTVFLKRFETRTGTHTALGVANIYENLDQAKHVEPAYVVKRNTPPEKPKEEPKG
jgi:small subunit ribosomal protein S24e